MDLLLNVIIFGGLITLGVLAGGRAERRHFKDLERREAQTRRFPVSNLKTIPQTHSVAESFLVMGQVVIASDYFKTFATQLRNLVGGEMKAAERLMARGRREALLRLVEDAIASGAHEVHNVRFGFCNITDMKGRGGALSVEVFAWGTAVTRRGGA